MQGSLTAKASSFVKESASSLMNSVSAALFWRLRMNRQPGAASRSLKWISTISSVQRVRSSPQFNPSGLAGFSPTDVEHIAVAGGIGSGINFKNAIRIGMLPDVPLEKYRYIGNSSLAGAYATLVSKAASVRLHELSKSMTYMELSVQPGYMDAFVAACFLPHTNGALFPSAGVW